MRRDSGSERAEKPYLLRFWRLAAETSVVYSEQESIDVDIDELVDWLEGLWQQDEQIRDTILQDEWEQFIESVKSVAEPE
jgi:hypothetical protein